MIQKLFLRCCFMLVCTYPYCKGQAQVEEISDEQVFDVSLCTKEELMMSFPPQIVAKVLLNAKYPPSIVEKITKELAERDQELSKLVDEKAQKYHPNPFKDLSRRDEALKIYQETLYEIFAGVMKKNGYDDEQQIRLELDAIRSLKSKLLIHCLRKH